MFVLHVVLRLVIVFNDCLSLSGWLLFLQTDDNRRRAYRVLSIHFFLAHPVLKNWMPTIVWVSCVDWDAGLMHIRIDTLSLLVPDCSRKRARIVERYDQKTVNVIWVQVGRLSFRQSYFIHNSSIQVIYVSLGKFWRWRFAGLELSLNLWQLCSQMRPNEGSSRSSPSSSTPPSRSGVMLGLIANVISKTAFNHPSTSSKSLPCFISNMLLRLTTPL